MKKIRSLALLLVLVQLLLLFAACGGEEAKTTGATPGTTTGAPVETPTTQNRVETPTTGQESTTGQEQTTTLPIPEGPERLCLVEDGEMLYRVIRSESAHSALNEIVQTFRAEVQELTGAVIRAHLDSTAPESDAEIVFGAPLNRPDVKEVCVDTAYTEARMQTSEGRIIFSAYTEENYKTLCSYFLRSLYEEEGNWYVDVDMINFSKNPDTRLEQPHYETENGRIQGFGAYLSMEGTVVASYDGTNRDEYEAYQEKLLARGYTKYTENQIGWVEFVTYVKGGSTVHVQFRGLEDHVTVNFFRNQLLPATEPEEYTALARAHIGLVPRYTYGLSMVLQLEDGTFIIIDGGKAYEAERESLCEYLMENKPAEHEKPIVSLWLLTHPHEDHVEMFAYDAEFFSERIELRMLTYNFPIFPCSEVDATGRYWNEYYHHAIEAKRAEFFPDAELWVAHTGQKLYLANAVVEPIYTHEDYYPGEIYSANDCNATYRITVDGVSLMVLGDNDRGNLEMTEMYGTALQAHIVQASHHGGNGPLEMYRAMDPMVVYWPDVRRNIEQRWELPFNRPWIHQPWRRQLESGTRVHYTASDSGCVYFDELKS